MYSSLGFTVILLISIITFPFKHSPPSECEDFLERNSLNGGVSRGHFMYVYVRQHKRPIKSDGQSAASIYIPPVYGISKQLLLTIEYLKKRAIFFSIKHEMWT